MVALFLRPDADQSDGSWLNESASATNLFASVDETSLSDADYMVSSTTDGDKVRLRLSDPSGGVAAPLIVRYRCKRTGTQAANLIGRLYQGTSPGTLITTFTQLSVSDSFTTYTYTLTSGEFASITDFTDLYVEFELSQQSSLKVDLNFAGGVYYDSGTVADATGNLSCSRASSGYAKNADGTLTSFSSNALRIGVGTGLLVEDARTNICAGSQSFNSGGGNWQNVFYISVTDNATVAPDGTTTAASIIGDTSTNPHRVNNQSALSTSAAQYAFSVYLKAGTYHYGWISAANTGTGGYGIIVDLNTGAITETNNTGSQTGVSSSVETLGNGWYRLIVTMNSAGASNTFLVFGPSPVAVSVAGWHGSGLGPGDANNGTSNIFAWGAQVEQGGFASSYVPTTSASVTRAADNITTSGSLQTAINAATASLVAQVDNGLVAGAAANIVDSNGTNLLGFNASNNALASITATLTTGNTANRTTQDKLGLAWNASGRSLVLNGGTVATDATAQTPSATQHVGSSGSVNFANAYVERLSAWATKLANATLQGFTV